jgi:hypothetical protein
MICSSLGRVPFLPVLLSWVWENSHSRRSVFRGYVRVFARHREPALNAVEEILLALAWKNTR